MQNYLWDSDSANLSGAWLLRSWHPVSAALLPVFGRKNVSDIPECFGELSLGFIAYLGGDGGDASVCLPEEFHSLADAVFLHVGGYRLSVNGFEDFLQGRGVDKVLAGQFFDSIAAVQILRQPSVNLANQFRLPGTVWSKTAGDGSISSEIQKKLLKLQPEIGQAQGFGGVVKGQKDTVCLKTGRDEYRLAGFPIFCAQSVQTISGFRKDVKRSFG